MPTNFVLGQIFMLIAAREIEAKPFELMTVPLKLALSYSAFVFVPVTLWYYFAHPGWSTVYLRPEGGFTAMAGVFIVSQYFFGMLLGAGLAQTLIQLKHKKAVYLTLGLGLLWLAGIWLLTLDEYLHIGTYQDYMAGRAPRIFDQKDFMNELNLMGVVLGLPAVALALYLKKRSKRH